MLSLVRRSDVPRGQSRTYSAVQRKTFVASSDTPPAPSPRSFADAAAAIDAIVARDRTDPGVAPSAVSRFYHHGGPVEHAVILFHGFTNCPQQFDALAQRLHRRGCNVYVPRLPYHGERDRLTHALDRLTPAVLADAATEAYTLASGLGSRVSACGLSLGGTMALSLAQTQPIAHAVPVAPFLMPIAVPGWFGLPAMTVISWLPDRYVWWDPRVKENCLPPYAYPGFPSHSLATLIFFGNDVVQSNAAARARRCTLVLNATESAVNNGYASALIDRWNATGAAYDRVMLDDLGAPRHDIIDPTTFPEALTLVYPKLESIILGS
jgi:pimeloyl-ACP methyl ester carboxylesterase